VFDKRGEHVVTGVRPFILAVVASWLCGASVSHAQEYKLAYWYEVGGHQNANGCNGCSCTGTGNHSLYVTVLNIYGQPMGNIRVEDADFPGFFGITNNNPADKLGFVEIPIPSDNSPRARVNDSGVPSDVTEEMIEARFPTWGHYSWECAFMFVPAGVGVTFDTAIRGTPNLSSTDGDAGCILDAPFTESCAYYDLDAFNWASDAFALDSGAANYGQTFVATGNRVAIAKFQTTRGFMLRYRYSVRIREGGPSGVIIGPAAQTREILSDEYFPQWVAWPLYGDDAIEVTPGETYYAEIYRSDQPGSINIYRRNNVYPDGQMYRGGTPVPDADLFGRVICATVGDLTPEIELSTTFLQPGPVECSQPGDQSFTVTNTGLGTLDYAVTPSQPWVHVTPTEGTLESEQTDAIAVRYDVAGLSSGSHSAQIVMADPNASNSPQIINVSLNVVSPLVPGDFDNDCDVDQEDFGHFQRCLTGPGIEVTDLSCLDAMLDNDADVDADDFGVFQACLSGANIAADPSCVGG
jgi:hypothetical protein